MYRGLCSQRSWTIAVPEPAEPLGFSRTTPLERLIRSNARWLVVWFSVTRGFGQLLFQDFVIAGLSRTTPLETINRSSARPLLWVLLSRAGPASSAVRPYIGHPGTSLFCTSRWDSPLQVRPLCPGPTTTAWSLTSWRYPADPPVTCSTQAHRFAAEMWNFCGMRYWRDTDH